MQHKTKLANFVYSWLGVRKVKWLQCRHSQGQK